MANRVKLVAQPDNLKVQLFPHQRSNIWKMENMERTKCVELPDGNILEGEVGILGDPPGTGKTFTVLGLICRNKMKWDIHQETVEITSQLCSNINGSLRIVKKRTFKRVNTNLIVTSLSIFHQWEREIKNTSLTYKMIDSRSECCNIEQYDIVVCTVNMYNYLASTYSDVCFKRFIYDEMDSAYISGMLPIQAGFSWFISATFSQVLHKINRSRKAHYLKRMFMNILSDVYSSEMLLESIKVQSSEKLRNLRPLPFEYKSVYYQVQRAPVVRALEDQMDQDLVQMIDAGNIKEAIFHLGGSEDDSNIADLMKRRANEKVREAEEKSVRYNGRQQEKWIERLAETRRILSTIEERIKGIEMDKCSLCSEEMKGPTLLECCQNITCARCIVSWMKNRQTCPYCRIVEPHLIHLSRYSIEFEDDEKKPFNMIPGNKFDFLEKIVDTDAKKLLIFAAYDNQFREIINCLERKNVSCSLLSGSVAKRESALNDFITGNTRVLVLNSRMNGAGLNLQVTTDIILWHSMPAPLTKQIVGRALRYGIDHPLTVHKFFQEEENE